MFFIWFDKMGLNHLNFDNEGLTEAMNKNERPRVHKSSCEIQAIDNFFLRFLKMKEKALNVANTNDMNFRQRTF